ncbi:MAG TPA: hypothetical protein VM513_27405 [Kofleriaceae bacterium]|jgi:hypothetical protein|nr:hypothetical protein [Kofleriaceae bacterium]
MTRKLLAVVLVVVGLGACDKPSEEDCRKAISNMQTLLGTDKLLAVEDLQGAVRRCKGSSSKKSVQCAIEATSVEALDKCGVMPESKPEPEPKKPEK